MAAPDIVRIAYREAAEHFVATAAAVPASQWEEPALGEWSTRDLVGHASRSLLTVEMYLSKGGTGIELRDAASYFVAALGSVVDESAVAERGRQAGIALGDDPAGAVRTIAARVLPVVDGAPDDAVVGTPWGGMRLIDYLPTRVFELTIHTLDLAAALDLQHHPSQAASTVTWELVAQLARLQGTENDVLLATTGRSPLPTGYSVLKSRQR